MFRLTFRSITFSDGTEIDVPPRGVVVFVGPNNAGKSAALRDLGRHLSNPTEQPIPRVVSRVDIVCDGEPADLREWLVRHAFAVDRIDGVYFQRVNANSRWIDLEQEWTMVAAPPGRPLLTPFVLLFAATDQRLSLLSEIAMHDPLSDVPTHPLQVVFAQPELEDRLAQLSFEAFGSRITLSRVAGSALRLHLGTVQEEPTVPATREYLDALRRIPLVQDQGDGVRSFLGLMLALLTAQYPIVVVDEPEAFLHPPQARLLGRKLATEVPEGTQIFVATHDGDILQGLLSSGADDITVVRLVREGEINRTRVLSAADVKTLWQDPLLRYSNVLQGLFHRGVVISESDADSRFYAAVLDAVNEHEDRPPHDLLFTQSGGKDRLPTVIRALRALDIPVAVIADFDLLRDDVLLKRIVDLLGGEWAEVETHWRVVHAAVEQLGLAPLVTTVREGIEKVLEGAVDTRLSKNDAEAIRRITRVDDAWQRAKQGGTSVLPQGEASERADGLLDRLRAMGLFVVPVGELERWVPGVSGHGPSWVSAVLEAGRHADSQGAAAGFMRTIVDQFQSGLPLVPAAEKAII